MRYLIGVLFGLLPTSVFGAYDLDVAYKIAEKAKEYGNSPSVSVAVLICESNLRHEGVYGDKGNAYGIAQFWASTFRTFKMLAGMDLDYKDMDDQIELFSWAMANGKQNHWTCYDKVFGK